MGERARLVLYTGESKYALQSICDEYTIECREGNAFVFSQTEWFAIALEHGGTRIPFASR
jgi:hypothetical protein